MLFRVQRIEVRVKNRFRTIRLDFRSSIARVKRTCKQSLPTKILCSITETNRRSTEIKNSWTRIWRQRRSNDSKAEIKGKWVWATIACRQTWPIHGALFTQPNKSLKFTGPKPSIRCPIRMNKQSLRPANIIKPTFSSNSSSKVKPTTWNWCSKLIKHSSTRNNTRMLVQQIRPLNNLPAKIFKIGFPIQFKIYLLVPRQV